MTRNNWPYFVVRFFVIDKKKVCEGEHFYNVMTSIKQKTQLALTKSQMKLCSKNTKLVFSKNAKQSLPGLKLQQ